MCRCYGLMTVSFVVEVHGTEIPLTKRPPFDAWIWQESAIKQHHNERQTKMKPNQLEDSRVQTVPQVRTNRLWIQFLFDFFDERLKLIIPTWHRGD